MKKNVHKKVIAFQGADDILSNFYPCQIRCHGIIAKSSEHAYNYVKAIRRGSPEVALAVKDAPTAALAKQAEKRLPFDPKWNDEKVQVIKDILIAKCDQVPEFHRALITSNKNKIVEAVPWDYFWGSGLNKKDTLHIKSKFWFGKNQMGNLLTEIRDSIQDGQNKSTRQQHKSRTNTQTQNNQSSVSDSTDSE